MKTLTAATRIATKVAWPQIFCSETHHQFNNSFAADKSALTWIAKCISISEILICRKARISPPKSLLQDPGLGLVPHLPSWPIGGYFCTAEQWVHGAFPEPPNSSGLHALGYTRCWLPTALSWIPLYDLPSAQHSHFPEFMPLPQDSCVQWAMGQRCESPAFWGLFPLQTCPGAGEGLVETASQLSSSLPRPASFSCFPDVHLFVYLVSEVQTKTREAKIIEGSSEASKREKPLPPCCGGAGVPFLKPLTRLDLSHTSPTAASLSASLFNTVFPSHNT